MATAGGGEKISSISNALKICGRAVDQEKLKKAEEAYHLLTSYASAVQTKDKFQHSRLLTEVKGSTYKDVTKQQKEAGGILFDVLYTIREYYNIDGVWQNYIFLISIYMDRKEYKRKVIQNLYPSDQGGPMELKVHYAIASAGYHPKQQEVEHVQLDPIKYVLTIARSWDKHNQTLQNDLDVARENYETLLESKKRLYDMNKEQYYYIKKRHRESQEPLSKETEAEKKVASKLFEILKYAVTKATKGSEKDYAIVALQDFHMLVDVHQASLRPVMGSESQRLDLQLLSKENILPKILEMVKMDLGERLYNNAMAELEDLQEKDNEVMDNVELRKRRLRWDEMKDEDKVQWLKEMEESNEFQNDVHRALCKAKKENIPGYDKALEYLASLLMSETLYNSRDTRMFKTPERPMSAVRKSHSFKDESTSTSFAGSQGSDVSSLKQHIAILESEVEFQQNQIQDLTTRLSKFATQQLTQGNPNIADLSDRNRPTNIGEKFGQVFDEEWAEAHDAFRVYSKSDMETMQTLISLIQSCYKFCQDIADKQQKTMEDQLQAAIWTPVAKVSGKTVLSVTPSIGADALSTITEKYAREYRKAAGACSVEGVTKLYRDQRLESDVTMVKKQDKVNMKKISNYTDKLIEYTWYMVIQDPPMVLHFIQKGEKISPQQYMYHERKGKVAEMCVWPALYLYNGGPVVKKGYVLPQ